MDKTNSFIYDSFDNTYKNFTQNDFTSEFQNNLINKDIDNYFNELINKSSISQNVTVPKSTFTFEKFYSDYIEHNLLFIVLLIGIIIFLIIRQYIKDYDDLDLDHSDVVLTDNKHKNQQSNQSNQSNQIKRMTKLEKINQLKKQQEFEKIQLDNYKKQLDMEKRQIMSIIDELSDLNDYEYSNLINPQYLNNNIGNENNQFSLLPSFKYSNQIDLNPREAHNSAETNQYYNMEKPLNDSSNKVGDIYIEPPFN